MGSRFRGIAKGMGVLFRFFTLACILIHLGAGSPGDVCTIYIEYWHICAIYYFKRDSVKEIERNITYMSAQVGTTAHWSWSIFMDPDVYLEISRK